MSDLPTTKPELQALRATLIETVEKANDTKTRMDAQLQLATVNAEIKRLNKIAAAEAKRDADIRKALGRKEAEANAARAAGGLPAPTDPGKDEGILIKAKQLHRELSRYPGVKPFHFSNLLESLTSFIDVQKGRVRGLESVKPAEPEQEAWQQTWSDSK